MRPVLVLPFHDPDGRLLEQLERIAGDLKQFFVRAFLSISPPTASDQVDRLQTLRDDPFFVLNQNEPGTQAGDHYLAGYRNAILHSAPTQQLHLCDIDKVAYALQSDYRTLFITDVRGTVDTPPLLFQRSLSAWATYPQIYRELEQMAIRIGELHFGRYFDFAWSYLIIEAQQLQALLSQIRSHDFGLLPEMVLLLREQLQTKDVDWLAWEDPFLCNRDAATLRMERDHEPSETRKRLLWNKAVLQQVLAAIE
ncbi:MAG: hypothetical protein R2932_06425 [Caldilineaceae bacterium]